MRNAVGAALVAILLALAVPATAQDIEAGTEAYQRGDYAAALRELRPLAEQGDAKAEFFLGSMILEGKGVRPDWIEAVRWCRKAAMQGHAESQAMLGMVYSEGWGGERGARLCRGGEVVSRGR